MAVELKTCAECEDSIIGNRYGNLNLIFSDPDEQRKGPPLFCSPECRDATITRLDGRIRIGIGADTHDTTGSQR